MDRSRPRSNPDGSFWLDQDSNVTEDDSGNFAQDDDVRDGARPIIRGGADASSSTAGAPRDEGSMPDREPASDGDDVARGRAAD